MWKIWLAVGFAVIAAVITAGMGILRQMRFAVILQRTIISVFVAGGGGYLLSLFVERIGVPYLLRGSFVKPTQPEEHPLAEEEETLHDDESEKASEMREETKFAPFTADNLSRVSPPNG